jgi:four helix bundle protein
MNDGLVTESRKLPGPEPLKDLRRRTKTLALRVIRLYSSLSKHGPANVIGHQLLRSGTSVGAHYCEAYRARSRAEFISKIEVGLQELGETNYWIELLIDGEIVPARRLTQLREEVQELIAVFTASAKTAKKGK